ncbi:MAG: chemotaxis protein CheD [Planctomycetota bacterium]|nr:chemotaxis protein CheD [Planctomycetota bacterium]
MSNHELSTDAGRVVIGIGGLAVRQASAGCIVTHALGSCLGIAIHDPVAKVGGMVHAQLPLAGQHPERAREMPSLFVDTGVRLLLERMLAAGARKTRWRLTVAGGANLATASDYFEIANRNLTVLRKLCWQQGLVIAGEDTGGAHPRTMLLDLASGATIVEAQGRRYEL